MESSKERCAPAVATQALRFWYQVCHMRERVFCIRVRAVPVSDLAKCDHAPLRKGMLPAKPVVTGGERVRGRAEWRLP